MSDPLADTIATALLDAPILSALTPGSVKIVVEPIAAHLAEAIRKAQRIETEWGIQLGMPTRNVIRLPSHVESAEIAASFASSWLTFQAYGATEPASVVFREKLVGSWLPVPEEPKP